MSASSPRPILFALAFAMTASANVAHADASRWHVAGGIGLGSDFHALYEGKLHYNVEVSGYRPGERREVGFTWILDGVEGGGLRLDHVQACDQDQRRAIPQGNLSDPHHSSRGRA